MRALHGILILGLVLRVLSPWAYGSGPRWKTDFELSQYPIIVVAAWDKARIRTHQSVEGDVCRAFEVFAEVNVHRVLKGNITPGKHTILLAFGIGWNEKDGTNLGSLTSTELSGDVQNVTKPNIWFLDVKRSWDTSDATLYYYLPHYRGVQPLVLERFFAAIASDKREREVPKLLASDNPEILTRTLRYICGGVWPWPNDPSDFEKAYLNPKERGKVLTEQAGAVRGVAERDVGDLRALAASVYAELAAEDGVAYMRTLLNDRDARVRATAIGVLAAHRDEASIEAMIRAVAGVDDGQIACKVIERLASWGDRRLVPTLVAFLQNDQFVYQYGDDLGVPALKARAALAEITGHWFPYDVAASTDAWKKVQTVTDPDRQKALLQELLPGSRFPVVAELVGIARYAIRRGDELDELTAIVRIRNTSQREVIIARCPTEIEQRWRGAVDGRGMGPPGNVKREDFVNLGPAESVDFEAPLFMGFLLAEPKSRSLKLMYTKNGNTVGVKAWIGVLEANYGAEWREDAARKMLETRWRRVELGAVVAVTVVVAAAALLMLCNRRRKAAASGKGVAAGAFGRAAEAPGRGNGGLQQRGPVQRDG